MNPSAAERLHQPDGHALAFHRLRGAGPSVIFLGGFGSDMEGSKALALHAWAQSAGRSFIRFDYFGHGASSGLFQDGSIGRWRSDVLRVVDALSEGPVILAGSSMGGWLACLAALARPGRVAGLVLMAPALDFTSALLEPALTAADRLALARDGVFRRPSAYGADYPITRAFLEEGRSWRLLPGPIAIDGPTRILQGASDPDVPWRHALKAAEAIRSPDVVFTLIKDGDHRLSRPQDLQRMIGAVEELGRDLA